MEIGMQLVQSNHASALAGAKFCEPGEVNNFACCMVKTQDDLITLKIELDFLGIRYEEFIEPDDNMGLTAIATEPIFGSKRKALRKYPLWRLNQT